MIRLDYLQGFASVSLTVASILVVSSLFIIKILEISDCFANHYSHKKQEHEPRWCAHL